MNFDPIFIPIILSILGLIYMYIKAKWVKKQDPGNEKMVSISSAIKKGALAFLNAEYRLLLIFVIVASAALFGISLVVETTSWLIIPAFVVGAIFSGLAGNIGMRIATDANSRTTQAARTSLPKALDVAFGGGTVMGLGVAGLAVLGLSLFFMFFINQFMNDGGDFYTNMTIVLEALAGFSLGAESKEAVDKFHKSALENGAADEGAPGLRSDGNYYGYVRDHDGNKITARCVLS